MKFMKNIIPLAVGAFFLTANAELPDKLIIINETSNDNLFIHTTYNESNIRSGIFIKINSTRMFNKFHEKQPNFLYIFANCKVGGFNYIERKFYGFVEKINIEYVIDYFLSNINSYEKMEDLKLNNFKIEPVYSIDNELIIILKDLY